MNKKLVGELELSDGVFEGARYLKVEFEEERKAVHFTLLNRSGELVDATGIMLHQDRGELITDADKWADRCLEKAADIDDLRSELAECRKQLAQKQ